MKNVIKCVIAIVSIFLIAGCGSDNKNKDKELVANLSNEIVLSEEGASAVCKVDTDMSSNNSYVIGAKFVIYADKNEIVTKMISIQLAESNDIDLLKAVMNKTEEDHDLAKEFGGYEYEMNLDGNRLYTKVTIDFTELDMEKMVEADSSLLTFLNDDYKYTLKEYMRMYEAVGVECTKK